MIPSNIISGRNAKEVYEVIRRRGTISKTDIKNISRLTGSTLTRILDELTEQGLIVEVGLGESTGGRRPILFRTNPSFAYVFGLDISRTNSRLVLCDLHLNKLDDYIWKMDVTMTPERLLQEVVEVIKQMYDRHHINEDNILGMGIGAVGPLDRINGRILDPQNFPSPTWKNIDICRIYQERLGFYTILDNGTNAALLGEFWSDSNDIIEHLLYLHVGVGIRSAMITGGQLVYGAVDMEGSVGQMIIQSDGLPPWHSEGNYGSLETYVSTYALEQAVKNALKIGRTSLLNQYTKHIDDIKYYMLEQALKENDPLAIEVFNQAASYFGIGLANLLNILHPQKVILGGPLISGNQLFYDQAIRVALNKTFYVPTYKVIFEKSKLGEDAVAIGAASIVIKQLSDL
ncbi:ROK family protein [Litchfieldia alkalitelluris]|uniref:ROK family protein n=1 Tax=Litchfieldia alkalitelluris TaxID=304268 RepID=UPI000996A31B|nr:ROK family protein [Litchfieldia alkalitelluris]